MQRHAAPQRLLVAVLHSCAWRRLQLQGHSTVAAGCTRVPVPKQGRAAALGSPEGGATLETGDWGEQSDSSSGGEESGLQDFIANLAAHGSSGGVRACVLDCISPPPAWVADHCGP